jgi:hypothetical protein
MARHDLTAADLLPPSPNLISLREAVQDRRACNLHLNDTRSAA